MVLETRVHTVDFVEVSSGLRETPALKEGGGHSSGRPGGDRGRRYRG